MSALNQIAQHLKVEVSRITRCEEWAKVWFVVIQGKGARFVSKKVVKMNQKQPKYNILNRHQFESLKKSNYDGTCYYYTEHYVYQLREDNSVDVWGYEETLNCARIQGEIMYLQSVIPS